MFKRLQSLWNVHCYHSSPLQCVVRVSYSKQYKRPLKDNTARLDGAFAHALGVQKDGLLIILNIIIKKRKERRRRRKEKRRGNALRTMGEERDDNIIYIFVIQSVQKK